MARRFIKTLLTAVAVTVVAVSVNFVGAEILSPMQREVFRSLVERMF